MYLKLVKLVLYYLTKKISRSIVLLWGLDFELWNTNEYFSVNLEQSVSETEKLELYNSTLQFESYRNTQ